MATEEKIMDLEEVHENLEIKGKSLSHVSKTFNKESYDSGRRDNMLTEAD